MPEFLPWSSQLPQQAGNRPLAVLVGASWDRWTKALLEALEDAGVAVALKEFAAVRVNSEFRPDIARRLAPGGGATLALLTPDGHPLVATSWAPARTLREILSAASVQWRTRAPLIVEQAKKSQEAAKAFSAMRPRRGAVDEAFVKACVEELVETCDPARGGWGGPPLELCTAALTILARRSDLEGAGSALVRTISGICQAGMKRRDGVVLHSSESASAEAPDGVALLVEQEEFRRAWVRALDLAIHKDPLRVTTLLPTGMEEPIPITVAGTGITECEFRAAAFRPLGEADRVLLRERRDPATGLFHRVAGGQGGIFHFADQAAALECIDGLDPPEAVPFARTLVRCFWDETASAFRDRFGPPLELAPLDTPHFPVEDNAIAAGALARLGGEWLELGKRCLGSFTDAFCGQGVGAARLAIAVQAVVEAQA